MQVGDRGQRCVSGVCRAAKHDYQTHAGPQDPQSAPRAPPARAGNGERKRKRKRKRMVAISTLPALQSSPVQSPGCSFRLPPPHSLTPLHSPTPNSNPRPSFNVQRALLYRKHASSLLARHCPLSPTPLSFCPPLRPVSVATSPHPCATPGNGDRHPASAPQHTQ